MDIHEYWSLPPEQQAAIRIAVLEAEGPRKAKHQAAGIAAGPVRDAAGNRLGATRSIRNYWTWPPTEQAALRAAALQPEPRRRRKSPVAVIAYTPLPDGDRDPYGYKAIYARDLLHGLGDVENVDGRSDADCIEAAEILGFVWTGRGWSPAER